MDPLAFAAKLIEVLVWPAVVLVLLYYMRSHLSGLAARLEELTLPGGTKAKFGKELEKAKEKAAEVSVLTGDPAQPQPLTILGMRTLGEDTRTTTEDAEFLSIANLYPEAAIMMAWLEVEKMLAYAGPKLDLEGRQANDPMSVMRKAREVGFFDDELVDLTKRLHRLRSLAVHGRLPDKPTFGEALEYRRLCQLVVERLRAQFCSIPGSESWFVEPDSRTTQNDLRP